MTQSSPTSSEQPRLSQLAKHLKYPDGIVRSDWNAVSRLAAKCGIRFDRWQAGLGTLLFGKTKDGQYAAGTGGAAMSLCRQVGKTYLLGNSVNMLCIIKPNTTVLWTAHRTRTAGETFRHMQALAQNKAVARHVRTVSRGAGKEAIEFTNGSRIMFGAREQGFGRGFDAIDMEIFDEAQILTEKALEDMVPAVNAAPNGLIVYMGTPPRPTDPSEVFTRLRREALAGEPGLMWCEFGADDDIKDLDDHEQWRRANPSYPLRTSENSILRLRRQLSDDAFRREALGVWDRQTVKRAIDPALWAETAVAAPDMDGLRGFAIDMAPDRSTICIGAAVKHADGSIHTELAAYKDAYHEGTRWAVDWIAERWPKTAAVVIDGQSPAMSLLPDLKKAHVRPIITGANDMGRACGTILDRLHDHTLTHLPDEQQPALAKAVQGAVTRPIGKSGAVGWNKTGSDTDISPLVACTLAAYGLTVTKRNPDRKQKVMI